MKEKILSRMHKIVAVLLLLVGVFALVVALKDLRIGTFAKPQGGLAPMVFSIGLIFFSVINLFIELRKENSIPDGLKDINWKKFALYVVICCAYVFLISKIGFIFDTFVCLFAMIKITGEKKWLRPLLISAVFSVVLWALFKYAMNVPLPKAGWLRR